MSHRDLKPENMLVDHRENTLKLCDFGFTKSVQGDMKDGTVNSYVGTPCYMDPVIYRAKGSAPYDPVKADLWSLGVILFITVFGNFPFNKPHPKDSFFNAISRQKWEQFWEIHESKASPASQELKELLAMMM